ncbi:hypothetical protein LJK88_10625 [Paenibacillus sp. P26]|nr:hypothetical protein LJK88_10625 [Paenibacillus sp. P26]
MKRQQPWKRAAVKTAITAACLGLIYPVIPAPSAFAGKEGVFINNSTYFTLEEARLSTGGDAGTLQFVVRLNNGGSQAVDFNAYGVKVTDDSGLSYAARLTEQQSARVQPGENRDFRFTAQVPPGEKASQLKVDIVAWDYGSSSVSREVGGLHVANVAAEDTNVKRTVISLNEADSSLPQNATVSFTAGRSILVSEDGKSYLYTDVMARNLGSSNFKFAVRCEIPL